MSQDLFARHQATLAGAVAALTSRTYWSAYPENASGRIYGESAAADGEAAFQARLNKPFALTQPGQVGQVGGELSPFGFALGVSYPKSDLDLLLPAMTAALPAWRKIGLEARVGVCLEILARLNKRSFEIAHAVMHTTGQAFAMAFQAGGPHAQDRGLEAVAYGWLAQKDVPAKALWAKTVAKDTIETLEKHYHLAGRGLSLMIGCSTFPTWNGYPGLFASLVTGNAVVVKPHPAAILPLAISVEIAREVLAEQGLPADLVTLVVDEASAPIAKDLALRPEIRIIDFTGSSQFGDWLEQNARQAQVYTEKAGVNFVILDSVQDLKGVTRNLAFALSLYSGQMCTTPQNIFIPRDGIRTAEGTLSFEQVAQALAQGVDKFLSVPERAVEILGAIQSNATAQRLEEAHSLGPVLLESKSLTHPKYPEARVRTPLLLQLDAARDGDKLTRELFGPIVLVIATDSTAHSIQLATDIAKSQGAITAGIYSTDPAILVQAEEACIDAGVALSENLTGAIFVNQSAAFSDYHATGANPAANASLTDLAFVANRFRIIQNRRPVA